MPEPADERREEGASPGRPACFFCGSTERLHRGRHTKWHCDDLAACLKRIESDETLHTAAAAALANATLEVAAEAPAPEASS